MRAALAGQPEPACDLEHAPDLESGLRRLARKGIDLVLLDLHLPGSRGLETLARVQATAPGLPVIVVTGSDDEHLADQALQGGAEDLVVKGTPHFVGVLRRSIGSSLERIQVLEALRTISPPATATVPRA